MKVNRFKFDEQWTVAEEYDRLRNMGENRQKIVCVHTQSYLTFCKPVDCSPLGSTVHGIFQARILEWIATSCSRGSSWPRDWTCVSCVSCISRWILYHQGTWEEQRTVINSFRKNEAAGLKWRQCLVVDVSGGKSQSDDVKNNIA